VKTKHMVYAALAAVAAYAAYKKFYKKQMLIPKLGF
jgi:hypothetical protein